MRRDEARCVAEPLPAERGCKVGAAKAEYHAFALAAQLIIGSGAVVGKLGLTSFNPLLFATLREAGAVPCFALLHAWLWQEAPRLPPSLAQRLALLGVCLFVNQACFIAGVKMANPVTASAWQLALPIETAAIAVAIGRERLTMRKVMAGGVGLVGALVLVVGGSGAPDDRPIGHLLFFLNTFASACFLILSKPALAAYPATLVTTWAYFFASLMMFSLTAGVAGVPALHNVVCPDCVSPWHIPEGAQFAIFYWILVVTAGGYSCMVFANRGLESSYVSFYTVCQPLVSTLLSVTLIEAGFNPNGALQMPGWNLVGALGIVLGLVLVVTEPEDRR